MSNSLMKECWPLQMSPTQKSVLMSLADQANEEKVCWPSVALICVRTCSSERAVQQALSDLQAAGAIFRTYRPNTSSLFTITLSNFKQDVLNELNASRSKKKIKVGALDAPLKGHKFSTSGASDAPGGATNAPEGATSARLEVQQMPDGGAADAPKSSVNPLSNPSLKINSIIKTHNTTDDSKVLCSKIVDYLLRSSIVDVSVDNPVLKSLVAQGVGFGEFEFAAKVATQKQRTSFGYVKGIIENRLSQAAQINVSVHKTNSTPDWAATQSGIRQKGKELGLGDWDEYAASLGRGEYFKNYEGRVMSAYKAAIEAST